MRRRKPSLTRNTGASVRRALLRVERLEERALLTYFGPPAYYGTWQSVYGLASADLDLDGDLDLLAEHNTSVSVLLNNGDGSFELPANYPCVDRAEGVAAGDFNEDGSPDYAVGGGPVVGVRLGNGDGTFRSEQTFAAGGGLVRGVLTADFDQDGHLDLVTANWFNNTISMLRGTGDGRFYTFVTSPAGGLPIHLVAADFNQDGLLDVAVNNYLAGGASVLLGNGDGSFQPPWFLATGADATGLDAGDADGDGDVDLVVTNRGNQLVSILLNHGDAQFAAPRHYAASSGPVSVAMQDFDGDGDRDLAVGNENGWLSFLLNYGDGTFEPPYSYSTGGGSWAMLAADFDGDLAPDVAVNGVFARTVGILRNLSATPAYFEVTAPESVLAGLTFDLTVTARNQFGGTAVGYTGTVRFSSSDPKADLPPEYTFTAEDQGTRTFGATLVTLGKQVIAVIDIDAEWPAGEVLVAVVDAGFLPGGGGGLPAWFVDLSEEPFALPRRRGRFS